MALNIKFYYTMAGMGLTAMSWAALGSQHHATGIATPVTACVIAREVVLTKPYREKIAECLGWRPESSSSLCYGHYEEVQVMPLTGDEVQLRANHVSAYADGHSTLRGQVEVRQSQRIVNAQTASIYRDAKTKQVKEIVLFDEVRYLEPQRLMIARRATINPENKSGHVEDVLYRFDFLHRSATLPAWGRASWVERFANQDYLLRRATYTTCAPQDNAWQIEASEIVLDHAKSRGVAKNATLRIHDWPVMYTPYLSFPTSNERKSGFLMPMPGYSNVGGFDLATPYYWNIAPNYDATLVPHLYTFRGMMMGGNFRFLTPQSSGLIDGNFLPRDRAFNHYRLENQAEYPSLRGISNDRWSFLVREHTALSRDLQMNINYRQVSDDYYLQDFSSNLEVMTQNQLLRQGDLTYTTDHWLLKGMLESYQTLHPINQSFISNIYERLPQFSAQASYSDLPMQATFNLLGEFDYFRWPANDNMQPQGPRYHLNPILSFPYLKPWGYMTPSVQLVENHYNVNYIGEPIGGSFNRAIPRYSLDSGLLFERPTAFMGEGLTQTLEPRLYYLYVPFHDQTPVPVYDSAYMIFNHDQLFRTNRFSGFDRIGDGNQLAYALTSRWLSERNGREKASVSIGQLRYFADRQVQLCYQQDGTCMDSSLMLGYLSPVAKSSPIASRAMYQLNAFWAANGDYIWDPYTHATNNGNLNIHYQPAMNHIIRFGYSYLAEGNVLQVANDAIQNGALHQATFAYAWPFTERISGLGAYSYNLSKGYSMMTFVGLQYEDCCWAMRLIGGRAFQSLSPNTLAPQYNNNIYFQILLKGLGSVANSDPASTINSYLPGYRNMF